VLVGGGCEVELFVVEPNIKPDVEVFWVVLVDVDGVLVVVAPNV